MRFVRYINESGTISHGWSYDDNVGPLEGSPFGEFRRLDATKKIDDVQLLAPVSPSKIICVGRNYSAHAQEHDSEVPDVPLLFLKPPSSIIGHHQKIRIPPQSQHVEHEAELVIVIGKKGRWIPPDDTLDHVIGYTIGNDVTARDLQRSDNQWTRAKGFDTFCPIGPWVETDFDPADAMITCHVNEELHQMSSTRDMVFTVQQIIAYASSVMTLIPGDLIFTGTPAGVSPIYPGDIVEVNIEGIGSLINSVDNETIQ